MPNCDSWAQFWVALPATLGALAAFVATVRNGRKADAIASSVNGHLTRLDAKKEAYERVIADLAPKVEAPAEDA